MREKYVRKEAAAACSSDWATRPAIWKWEMYGVAPPLPTESNLPEYPAGNFDCFVSEFREVLSRGGDIEQELGEW